MALQPWEIFFFFATANPGFHGRSGHLNHSRNGAPQPMFQTEAGRHMIELTRLNGHPLVVNAELIKIVEESPDTVITLVTNDKMVVRETVGEVITRVVAYRRKLLVSSSTTLGRGRAAARQNSKE